MVYSPILMNPIEPSPHTAGQSGSCPATREIDWCLEWQVVLLESRRENYISGYGGNGWAEEGGG